MINSILQKIKKHSNLIAIIVIAVLTCIVGSFLFKGVLASGHDALGGMTKFAQFDQVFQQGFFPVRWLPYINFGYGEPTFVFYAPMFCYLGSFFRLLGLNYVNAVNSSIFILWFLSGVGMYLLAKEFFGWEGGLIAAAAFIFAPYHISQIYVRSGFAEFAATTWFPFILWAFYKLWKEGKLKYFFWASLFSCLLFISHNILTLFFGPVIVVFILVLWWGERKLDSRLRGNDIPLDSRLAPPLKPMATRGRGNDRKSDEILKQVQDDNTKNLVKSFSALTLGGFCSFFFLVPAFLEKKYVQIGKIMDSYYSYTNHFVYFKQLVYSPWGYGSSNLPNVADGMSFMVGHLHWLLLGVAIYFLVKFWDKEQNKREKIILLFFIILFGISAFLTLFISAPFWRMIPLMQFAQFPWRWLAIVILAVSFLSGSVMYFFKEKSELVKLLVALFFIVLFVIFNIGYIRPEKAFNIMGDDVYMKEKVVQGAMVSGMLEYTPIWGKEVPELVADEKYEILEGDVEVISKDIQTQKYIIDFSAKKDSKIRINTYYFPGWQILIDGKETEINYTNSQGLMDFNLPAGEHKVVVSFGKTFIRKYSEIISWIAWLILFVIFGIIFYRAVKDWKLKRTQKAEQRKLEAEKRKQEISINPNEKIFSRVDYIIAGVTSLACFCLYWFTLVPTVYSGDSGEMTAAISGLGVPHPTGFPLYILTAKFFSVIWPFGGNTAYKINLFSGFCGALVILILYFICRKFLSWYFSQDLELVTEKGRNINISNIVQRILSVSTCLMLAFSLQFWAHSLATKVYTCTALMAAIQILFILYWYESRQEKFIYWTAFACGLGLCTHITGGLPAVAFVVIVYFTDKRWLFNKKVVGKAILAGMAPAVLYLYIPWAARRKPYVNQDNPWNLENFIWYITQKDYRFKMANRTLAGYLTVIWTSFKFYFQEFTVVGFVLAITGIVAFWKKCKHIFYGFFVLMACNIAIMMAYGNEEDLFILERYFLPSYIVMSIFILLGLFYLWEIVLRLNNNKARIALFVFIIFVPLIPLRVFYHKNNQRNNYIVENFGHNLLGSMEKNSIFFTLGDAVSGPIWYLHGGLDERPDVVIVEAALVTHDWYLEQLHERHPDMIPIELKDIYPYDRFKYIVEHNFDKFSIYTSYNSDETIKEKYKYVPYGLVNKVLATTTEISLEDYKTKNTELWKMYNYDGLLDENIYKEYMVNEIVDQYAKAHNNLAVQYTNLGDKTMAMYELEEALKYNADDFPALYNLSGLYKERGDYKKSGELMLKAKEVNPDFFMEQKANSKKYEVVQNSKNTQEISSSLEGQARALDYLNQGIQFGQKEMHQEAINAFETAKEFDPNSEIVRLNLGNAYAITEQFEKAVAEFEAVCEINPENAMAHLNIGSICVNNLHLPDKAIEHLQSFIELSPYDEKVPQIEQVLIQLNVMKIQSQD